MIRLIDAFVLDSDGTKYILRRELKGMRKSPTTGEKEETTVYIGEGYYPTMQGALKACVRKCMMANVASGAIKTMREWVAVCEKLTEKVERLVNNENA